MAKVVLTEREFTTLFDQSILERAGNSKEAGQIVRRPLRGIQLKRETFASLSVLGGAGVSGIHNSSAKEDTAGVNSTSNFIIQSVQEQRMEKFQAITTFGAPYGFFFGEQPRMLTVQAVLLNTADFQWEIEWWQNYEDYFRGTQLVNRGVRCYLTFDDTVVEGYMTQASTAKNSGQPYESRLSFSMWVTNVDYLVEPGRRSVDPRHDLSSSTESLAFDYVETGPNEEFVSETTAAVRAANIRSLREGEGLLASLRNAIDSVDDAIDGIVNTLDGALDFLYGRNMVIPAGFAGSEIAAGGATFASGSGFEELRDAYLGNDFSAGALNIRIPVLPQGQARAVTQFYDNIDEYPARAATENTIRTLEEARAAVISEFGSTAGDSPVDQDELRTQLAESTFREFGYDISNAEGQSQGELLRLLGRVAFGAFSYAAMRTGLSQSIAELTIIGGTTGNTDAEQQAAAAGA